MKRLETTSFGSGPGKILLGASETPDGIITTHFLIGIYRCIKFASAEEFTASDYEPVDYKALGASSKKVVDRYDKWQHFRFVTDPRRAKEYEEATICRFCT